MGPGVLRRAAIVIRDKKGRQCLPVFTPARLDPRIIPCPHRVMSLSELPSSFHRFCLLYDYSDLLSFLPCGKMCCTSERPLVALDSWAPLFPAVFRVRFLPALYCVVSYQHFTGVFSYQHSTGVVYYQHSTGVVSYQHFTGGVSYQHSTGVVSYQHFTGVVSQQDFTGVVSYQHFTCLL